MGINDIKLTGRYKDGLTTKVFTGDVNFGDNDFGENSVGNVTEDVKNLLDFKANIEDESVVAASNTNLITDESELFDGDKLTNSLNARDEVVALNVGKINNIESALATVEVVKNYEGIQPDFTKTAQDIISNIPLILDIDEDLDPIGDVVMWTLANNQITFTKDVNSLILKQTVEVNNTPDNSTHSLQIRIFDLGANDFVKENLTSVTVGTGGSNPDMIELSINITLSDNEINSIIGKEDINSMVGLRVQLEVLSDMSGGQTTTDGNLTLATTLGIPLTSSTGISTAALSINDQNVRTAYEIDLKSIDQNRPWSIRGNMFFAANRNPSGDDIDLTKDIIVMSAVDNAQALINSDSNLIYDYINSTPEYFKYQVRSNTTETVWSAGCCGNDDTTCDFFFSKRSSTTDKINWRMVGGDIDALINEDHINSFTAYGEIPDNPKVIRIKTPRTGEPSSTSTINLELIYLDNGQRQNIPVSILTSSDDTIVLDVTSSILRQP